MFSDSLTLSSAFSECLRSLSKIKQMNTIGYFEIQSSEPSREIAFYKHIFGWNFIRENNMPVEYYRIGTNSINGGLLKRPAEAPATRMGTNAFVCSVQVKNFEVTQGLILSKGGMIAMPKFAIPGRCWQGYFVDRDQNVFGIFEVDDYAK
jgi:predicted enzyme related to lactoylglutathione lyase